MPLPEGKRAKELGFKEGDRFRVISESDNFKVGTEVTLTRDDGTLWPWFKDESGDELPVHFKYLEQVSDTCSQESNKSPAIPEVGRTIRILAWYFANGEVNHNYDGRLGKIISIDSPRFRIEFLDDSTTTVVWSKDEWAYVDDIPLADVGTSDFGILDVTQRTANCRREISPITATLRTQEQNTLSKGGSLMSKLSLLAKKVFDKDTKTLIKAGVLDTDLNVENAQFVLSFVVEQYKKELAALAQEQLDEAEK